MQVTKGTWRMREQCVPGSLSSSPAREPGKRLHSDVRLLEMLTAQEPFSRFASFQKAVNAKRER